MIAADTSTWIAFLQGHDDTRLLDQALKDRQVLMLPVVLTELLSDADFSSDIAETFSYLPLIDVVPGYWSARVRCERKYWRSGTGRD